MQAKRFAVIAAACALVTQAWAQPLNFDEVVESALQTPLIDRSARQLAASCNMGAFGGIVDMPAGIGRWTAPDPAPGQARGWIVRYEHRIVRGDDVEVWYEYEAVVKLAPKLEDRGRYGAIFLAGLTPDGLVLLDASGRPNYRTFSRQRSAGTGQLGMPAFMGALRGVHEFRVDFGRNPPAYAGELYVGYGLISQRAQEDNARYAQARQTMLPPRMAALDEQAARAREQPQAASEALQRSCAAYQQAPDGRSAYAGEVGALQASNAQMLAEMCRKPDSDAMRRLCEHAAGKSQGADAASLQRQARIISQRAEAASSGKTSASQRRLDGEMQGICARGDVQALIERRKREATLLALDQETLAGLKFWEIRAAYDDGARRSHCWRTIQWGGQAQGGGL